MLTLILMRHAKAVKSAGDDAFRDLTDAGAADASRAGIALRERSLLPEVALVSPSARTRQTFEAVKAASDRSIEGRFPDALYNATSQTIRDLVGAIDGGATDGGAKTVMVVGHNPGIAEGVAALARDGALQAIDRLRAGFRPCSLAILTFDAEDWQAAIRAGGHLALLLTPDDFAA